MVDDLTPQQRSYCMSRIRSKNTKPEIIVRKVIHSMGYRFRLHRKDLPGKPDIVLPRLKKVIFVHGCFWHKHNCKYGRVKPKTNAEYWNKKRTATKIRDAEHRRKLKKLGWDVFIVWECETKRMDKLAKKTRSFLN